MRRSDCDLASVLQQAFNLLCSFSSYFNGDTSVVRRRRRRRGQRRLRWMGMSGAKKSFQKFSHTSAPTQPSAPYSCWSLPCAHLFFRVCRKARYIGTECIFSKLATVICYLDTSMNSSKLKIYSFRSNILKAQLKKLQDHRRPYFTAYLFQLLKFSQST